MKVEDIDAVPDVLSPPGELADELEGKNLTAKQKKNLKKKLQKKKKRQEKNGTGIDGQTESKIDAEE